MQIIIFKFLNNEMTVYKGTRVHHGCVNYAKLELPKWRTINIAPVPGTIFNNFVWYEFDGSEDQEKELKVKAAKVFQTRGNMRLHELEKAIDKNIEEDRTLRHIMEGLKL